jgi:uncharacterized membrane protein
MNGILEATSLPNLHPALVHFPVALLLTALALEAAAVVLRRERWWLDRAAACLLGLGAVSALLTYWSGRQAEDSLRDVAASAQPAIARHADMALWTSAFFLLFALVRIGIGVRVSRSGRQLALAPRLASLVALSVGAALLVVTADRGGALVYRHGVSVTVARPKGGTTSPLAPEASTFVPEVQSRLRHLADGSLEWTPEPTDSAALGTILHAPGGGTPHAVRFAGTPGKGLGLEVTGHGVLVLDGTFDDVQVEARVDMTGFAGEVGLVHHAQDAGDACLFVVSSEGRAALRVRSQGVDTDLDAAEAAIPGRPFTLTVSSAGGHQKGMIDGKTVVHGHRTPGPPGRVGVVVNGRGMVRILALRVVPLARGQA